MRGGERQDREGKERGRRKRGRRERGRREREETFEGGDTCKTARMKANDEAGLNPKPFSAYRVTSRIRNANPPRTTIGP